MHIIARYNAINNINHLQLSLGSNVLFVYLFVCLLFWPSDPSLPPLVRLDYESSTTGRETDTESFNDQFIQGVPRLITDVGFELQTNG